MRIFIINLTEITLHLHIKLKHNGGNKSEREQLAVIITNFEVLTIIVYYHVFLMIL